MNSSIFIFIFSTFLYFSAQALNCNDNPCELGGYFIENNDYHCIQMNNTALCICPGGAYEIDQPCRICNRTNPANNPCGASSAFLSCLETNEYGTTFACLCLSPSGPALTTSANCDLQVTLTSTATTSFSTTATVVPSKCSNGGYFVDNICHCPSGFAGILCEQKFDDRLCERIVCKNTAVCAVRNPDGPYESVCLCRYATWGQYCQLDGTLGFCTPGFCMNSAPCKEDIVEATRHAYCDCLPGYNGIRCENQYFKCFSNGKFIDHFMDEQGKYFECTSLNGSYRLERKSCPKGLRFNINKNACTSS